jgi:hypothetical protein
MKEHESLETIEFVQFAIKSERVLSCCGFTVGVIEEILEGMPPRVDLERLYEEIVAEMRNLNTDISAVAIRWSRVCTVNCVIGLRNNIAESLTLMN